MPQLRINAPNGKTYSMPWNKDIDPTEQEISTFIASQEGTPSPLKSVSPLSMDGLKQGLTDFSRTRELPSSSRGAGDFFTPAIPPIDTNDPSLATDSYPVRAGKELFNSFVSEGSSPAAVASGAVFGKGVSLARKYGNQWLSDSVYPWLVDRFGNKIPKGPINAGPAMPIDTPRIGAGRGPIQGEIVPDPLPTPPIVPKRLGSPYDPEFTPVGQEPTATIAPKIPDPVEEAYNRLLGNKGRQPLLKTDDLLNAESVKKNVLERLKPVNPVISPVTGSPIDPNLPRELHPVPIKNKPSPSDLDELNSLGELSLTRELTPEQENRFRELQNGLFGDTGIDPFDKVDNPLSDSSSFGLPEVPINKPNLKPVTTITPPDFQSPSFGNRKLQNRLSDVERIDPATGEILDGGGSIEPQFSRVDRIKPDEHRRGSQDNFEVYNTNTDKVHSYWPTEELAKRAAAKLGRENPEMDYRPSAERKLGKVLPIEPLFAKSEKGGIKVGQNIQRSIGELTTGYSNPLPGVMVREAMQNSIDAIRHLGNSGKINYRQTKTGFEITDNGKGMNRQQLETVFSNLHESGKTNEAGATGGKGIGKATYMMGGDHFLVETVHEAPNGKKYKLTMQGTPEEFAEHVGVDEVEVSPTTETGTLIRTEYGTKFPDGQYDSRRMLNEISRHTRDIPGEIEYDTNYDPKMKELLGNNYETVKTKFKPSSGDKEIGSLNLDGNDVSVHVPKDTGYSDSSSVNIVYLNNGMYQFSKYQYLGGKTANIPEEIIVNIKPSAEEGTVKYPFPTQRESVKDNIAEGLKKYIDEVLVNPQKKARASKLKELYESMQTIDTGSKTYRKPVMYDPGNRFYQEELSHITNSSTIKNLTRIFDTALNDMIEATGHGGDWGTRLEGVGFVFDPNMHGIHIPNPMNAGKTSTILINPFINMGSKAPKEAALDIVVTLQHEAAHIGLENTSVSPMSDEVINDPRIGKYLQTYMKEINAHGGSDYGHGFPFTNRLGDIYAKYGARNAFETADKIEAAIRGSDGWHSPEVQELLRLYQESRGRDAVTEDFLSGTGEKQRAPGSRGSNAKGNSKGHNSGASSGGGKGDSGLVPYGGGGQPPRPPSSPSRSAGALPPKPPKKIPNKDGLITQAGNFFKTMKGTLDISAPFRQGIQHVGHPYFWKNIPKMMENLVSEKAYGDRMDKIEKRLSYGQMRKAGLQFTNLTGDSAEREESMMSVLPEKIPVYGRLVRGSNRAFTGFINETRADAFDSLVNTFKAAKRPLDDNTYRRIADYVNTSTGRGSLDLGKLGNLEKHAKLLNAVFFSPRLASGRIRSLGYVLNPVNYIKMSDPVRRRALYDMAAMGAFGLTILTLAKMGGAEVEEDPRSADFGKMQVGNTRMEVFGGFSNYVRLGAQVLTGEVKSSTTNKVKSMWSGKPFDPTLFGQLSNFAQGKEAPLLSFFTKITQPTDFEGERVSIPAEVGKLFVPMIAEDVWKISKDNPSNLPFVLGGAAGFGLNTYGPRKKKANLFSVPRIR